MEEAVIKRILPHNTEAEQAVIGAMLLNKDAISEVSGLLAGADFYQPAYGVLLTPWWKCSSKGNWWT